MSKKSMILFALVGVLVVSAVGYAGYATTAPAAPAVQVPPTVAAATCDVVQSISAPGTLVNTHTVNVEMPGAGRLAEIRVKPGESVQAGQPLAKLANPASFAAVTAAAELEALQAQAALDELARSAPSKAAQLKVDLLNAQEAQTKAKNNLAALAFDRTSSSNLEKTQADFLLAEAQYQQAVKNYNATTSLSITNPDRMMALDRMLAAEKQYNQLRANLNWYLGKASADELAKAQGELDVAAAKVAETQYALDHLKNGIDPIEEAKGKLRLAEAQAKLEAARQVEGDGLIRAPFSGVVLGVSASPGESLGAGAAILSLREPKALEVKSNVTEQDYPLLAQNQGVELFFDARPELTLQGKVERIVPKRIEGDRPLYNIYISLGQAPDGLVDGMTADAAVTIARRDGVVCLPRAVVRASGGNKTTVKVWTGLQTETRQIEIGLRGDTNVEIISGLKIGEQVVVK